MNTCIWFPCYMNTCMVSLLHEHMYVRPPIYQCSCLPDVNSLQSGDISVISKVEGVYNSVRYSWLEYASTLNIIVGGNKYKYSMIKRN